MNKLNLKKTIESLLLVAEKPVTAKEIARLVKTSAQDIEKATFELMKEYEDRGIKIIQKGKYFRMTTDPKSADVVSRFINEELRQEISKAGLETLSIITYKQPVTRADIEEIRGAASDQILRNLAIRGLIQEVGRKNSPGRPILYGTTIEFLQYFGIKSEEELKNQKEITNT